METPFTDYLRDEHKLQEIDEPFETWIENIPVKSLVEKANEAMNLVIGMDIINLEQEL